MNPKRLPGDQRSWYLKASILAMGILTIVFLASGYLFSFPGFLHRRQVEKVRPGLLRHTMRRATPLIEAIRRYEKETGKPPDQLTSLVPKYLLSLPEPGELAKGSWRYERNNTHSEDGWALFLLVRSEFSPNKWSFGDYFVYHSNGKYEPKDYGGILERVGGWAYYLE